MAAGLRYTATSDDQGDTITGQCGTQANLNVIGVGEAGYVLRETWTAAPGKSVGITADVELTDCYNFDVVESNGGSANATPTLTAIQLGPSGDACQAAQTESQPITIPADVHHEKVYLSLRGIAVSTSPACVANFAIKVLVSVGGNRNSMIIETPSCTNGIAFSY